MTGLTQARFAGANEFTELGLIGESMTLDEQIRVELESEGSMTATQLAERLGRDRTYVTKILTAGEEFEGHRVGREVLYKLRAISPPQKEMPIVTEELPQLPF